MHPRRPAGHTTVRRRPQYVYSFSNLHPLLGEARVWALLAEFSPLVWLTCSRGGGGQCCFEVAGAERVFDGLVVGTRPMAMRPCAPSTARGRVEPQLQRYDETSQSVVLITSSLAFAAFWSRFTRAPLRAEPHTTEHTWLRVITRELRAVVMRIRAECGALGNLIDCRAHGVDASLVPGQPWLLALRFATTSDARRAYESIARDTPSACSRRLISWETAIEAQARFSNSR
tara:strand:+ start:3441 stop:4130 length:690 start_codon:yes stop_codon:yes gene_type:complete